MENALAEMLGYGLLSGGLITYGFCRRSKTKKVRNDQRTGIYGEPTYDTVDDEDAKRDGNMAIGIGLLFLVAAARVIL